MTAPFAAGTRVRVKSLYPPGHCRTPFYTRGRIGTILGVADHQPNPEEVAYGRPGLPQLAVYRVSFPLGELWPEQTGATPGGAVVVDLFEPWLEQVAGGGP